MSRWTLLMFAAAILGGSCSLAYARHGSHHSDFHEPCTDGGCRHFEYEHHHRGSHEHLEDYHRPQYEHFGNGPARQQAPLNESAPPPPRPQ